MWTESLIKKLIDALKSKQNWSNLTGDILKNIFVNGNYCTLKLNSTNFVLGALFHNMIYKNMILQPCRVNDDNIEKWSPYSNIIIKQ